MGSWGGVKINLCLTLGKDFYAVVGYFQAAIIIVYYYYCHMYNGVTICYGIPKTFLISMTRLSTYKRADELFKIKLISKHKFQA